MKRFVLFLALVLSSVYVEAQIKYIKTDAGYKVQATNLTDKYLVQATDGLLLFFDSKGDNYSALLTIIPKSSADLKRLVSYFSSDKISFWLDHGWLELRTDKGKVLLYADNSQVRKALGDKADQGLSLNQLSFYHGRKYDKKALEPQVGQSVNEYLLKIAGTE